MGAHIKDLTISNWDKRTQTRVDLKRCLHLDGTDLVVVTFWLV